MRPLMLAIAIFAVAALASAADLAQTTQYKLDLIQSGRVRPGSSVTFTPAEINAWARMKIPQIVPEGIRGEHVQFGEGTATGTAIVDLLKMRQAKGAQTNWLVARMIQGERPLKVSVRLESGGGRCTVYVMQVELSNITINGNVLDFLIKTFFMPLYPEAKIDQPFDLAYNIERIEIHPDRAIVTMKK